MHAKIVMYGVNFYVTAGNFYRKKKTDEVFHPISYKCSVENTGEVRCSLFQMLSPALLCHLVFNLEISTSAKWDIYIRQKHLKMI